MAKKTIVYKTYTDPASASIDCDVLKEAGVDCFLSDVNVVQLYPMFSSPFGGIKLHIFEEDKATVDSILKDFHSQE